MEKLEAEQLLLAPTERKPKTKSKLWSKATWCGLFVSVAVLAFASLDRWGFFRQQIHYPTNAIGFTERPKVVRHYNVTVGFRWMNLDGGRWRPIFVCNGQSPCPTLTAREGDELDLHVINDLGAQLSLHWSGMSHRRLGFWNDGTGGLNQFPILPRGNWTSRFDTAGHWGVNWYADHTGAGVADGVYGMIYVSPSPERPRPYSKITDDPVELELIMEAEDKVRNTALWNLDHRAVDWKVAKLKAKGENYGLYCYKSIMVNGKGRVHCKNPNFPTIGDVELNGDGCVPQKGFEPELPCKPSTADYQVFETNGEAYMMFNLINVGFEHALKWSIDDHKMWVVATDAGFVQPQLVDTVYVTNGAHVMVLVKLDKEPGDYTIRQASTSILQNLEGYSILRYPAKRYPIYGQPMLLPPVTNETRVCLNADSSIPKGCKELDHRSVRTFPDRNPPQHTDQTFKWEAGAQQSEYMEHITEYYVNKKPWQLFRAAMEPVFFTNDTSKVEKPVQAGLPFGSVIDLIVQNTLNETIPMYKHGSPTFELGKAAHSEFEWSNIAEAVKAGAPLSVTEAPLMIVHDLPPLGWLALRWKVDLRGATMFHAVKLKYFALGMAAPMLEGFEGSMRDEIPMYAKNQPHIVFAPANDGVLG